jgi:hypothetical protein
MKKKFIAVLILCIALAFGLAACGDKSGDTPSDSNGANTDVTTDSKDKDDSESEGGKETFPQFDEKTRVYKTGYGIDEKFSFVLPEGWEVKQDQFPHKGRLLVFGHTTGMDLTLESFSDTLGNYIEGEEEFVKLGEYVKLGNNEYYTYRSEGGKGEYFLIESPLGNTFRFVRFETAMGDLGVESILESFTFEP